MNPHKPYTLGTFEATEPMRHLVKSVLDSGRLSYGPLSHEFEEMFAEIHGCAYGILVSSGTDALRLSLQALKERHNWPDGSEVIVPAITFVATLNIVYQCRMIPVLVDVDPIYYAIDPEKIESAITPNTRCIIPVHPFGQSADMVAITAISRKHKLLVIEDSCEAMFVSHEGESVGSWSEVGCFSTYVAHILTTGVGGICTTHDKELALHIRSLANHGIDVSQLPSSDTYDPSHLGRHFRFTSIGYSSRLTELEAAIGLAQLREWPAYMEKRSRNAAHLHEVLHRFDDRMILPAERNSGDHAYMVFPIVMRYQPKDEIMTFLRAHGIECRDMLPITTQPCYKFLPFLFPVAQRINTHGFYIGCHHGHTREQIDEVAETFAEFFADEIHQDIDFYQSGEKRGTQSA